jgi:hypothetical protein
VVKFISTWTIKHTTLVELESTLVGFDGDGNWSNGDGSDESIFVAFWDVSVGLDAGDLVGFLGVLARLVGHLVWVVGF